MQTKISEGATKIETSIRYDIGSGAVYLVVIQTRDDGSIVAIDKSAMRDTVYKVDRWLGHYIETTQHPAPGAEETTR